MIIIDYSQIGISNIFRETKGKVNPDDIDANMVRHMIINSIRALLVKFRGAYGNTVIIACDSRTSWRRDFFPHYKVKRRRTKDKDTTDWTQVYNVLEMIKQELEAHFPYHVIEVNGAEADDVIAVLATGVDRQPNERVLIVSGDKDFFQLQRYEWIDQYDLKSKKLVKVDNPLQVLKEHVLRGDDGDSIPNFLSDDKVFEEKRRQKSLFETQMAEWLNKPLEHWDDTPQKDNVRRNRTLIDFESIPPDVWNNIVQKYAQPIPTGESILAYLSAHRMKNLIPHLTELY